MTVFPQIGRKNNIGKDIGELTAIATLGVVLEKDAEAIINQTQPEFWHKDCNII